MCNLLSCSSPASAAAWAAVVAGPSEDLSIFGSCPRCLRTAPRLSASGWCSGVPGRRSSVGCRTVSRPCRFSLCSPNWSARRCCTVICVRLRSPSSPPRRFCSRESTWPKAECRMLLKVKWSFRTHGYTFADKREKWPFWPLNDGLKSGAWNKRTKKRNYSYFVYPEWHTAGSRTYCSMCRSDLRQCRAHCRAPKAEANRCRWPVARRSRSETGNANSFVELRRWMAGLSSNTCREKLGFINLFGCLASQNVGSGRNENIKYTSVLRYLLLLVKWAYKLITVFVAWARNGKLFLKLK